MRKALVFFHDIPAGMLTENSPGKSYVFDYEPQYEGPPISLTLPKKNQSTAFDRFPPFFDGLLPEGPQLEGLLKISKLDRTDYFGQLLTVGEDLVGAVTLKKPI